MLIKDLLNGTRRKGWLKRQTTLKKWRDQIWEGNDKVGIKTYMDWHLDFFTRFYKAPSRSCTTLDIGCGYMVKNFYQVGKLNELMQIIGSKYVGIDPINDWFINDKQFDFELHHGHGEKLPFADERFDAVMILGVLDHVRDPMKVLHEAHRVLKKDGRLWFANSYIEGNTWEVLKTKLYHRFGFDKHHRYIWAPNNLELMISRANFSVVRTDRCLCDVSFYIEGMKEVIR